MAVGVGIAGICGPQLCLHFDCAPKLREKADARQLRVREYVGEAAAVRRVLLCSGKIAYPLLARRSAAEAVVRVEQLYPWPADQLADAIARYERADEVVWVQEEPENMGAWSFAEPRLRALLRDDYRLAHIARAASGSPAAGSSTFHELEERDLLERAVAR